MKFFTHVSLPKVLLMDQGSPFISTLMHKVCQLLGIEQRSAAVQHPQMNGLTQHPNQTLKGMLAKAVKAHPASWDLCVDPILFILRESPQSSTGFSPFELLYGRRPQRLLETLGAGVVEQPKSGSQEATEYLTQLQQHLHTTQHQNITHPGV